jgi:hypothetical protein
MQTQNNTTGRKRKKTQRRHYSIISVLIVWKEDEVSLVRDATDTVRVSSGFKGREFFLFYFVKRRIHAHYSTVGKPRFP